MIGPFLRRDFEIHRLRGCAVLVSGQIVRHYHLQDVFTARKYNPRPEQKLRCAPVRVILRQAGDQNPDLVGYLRPTAARPGSPPPVKTKAGTVPSDDCLRLHDDQYVSPSKPQALQSRPEKPVERVQRWPRPFSLENRDLLSESKNFKCGVASTAEEDAGGGQEYENVFDHELTVVT